MQSYLANPAAKIDVLQPGEEKAPVIIIDGALKNFKELIENACEIKDESASGLGRYGFASGRALYPGVCKPTPQAYQQFIFREIMPIVADVYKIAQHRLHHLNSDFSIVNAAQSDLHFRQRIPHCDGLNPAEIAMIHFFCEEKFGGTSLYRHKKTGYEFISKARQKSYFETLEQEANSVEQLDYAGYIHQDSSQFEKYFTCPAKMDRLFIYPCPVLHSGDIQDDYKVASHPKESRLTVTNFLYNASD